MNAEDNSRRFGGIDRLYGSGALAQMAAAHVTVIGIGGVGSWAVEALARSGVGRLTLIDLDHVAPSNMNRQIHALDSTLGTAKVLAMAERIAAINASCVVHGVEDFITPENLALLVPADALVIDAIDNVRAKAALIAHCKTRGQTVITTGGAGGRVDPTRIIVDDLSRTVQDALASKVRARLRKEYGFCRDPKRPFGVACVYSPEPAALPRRVASAEFCAGVDGAAGLACAGYGSSVAVTAAFGFAAASRALAGILRAS